MHKCKICGVGFGRRFNLERHTTKLHGMKEEPKSENGFTFLHPFTMLCCGPTGCGKTTLMKNILQKNQTLINPPPQRIIWLYKRWQPLYDVIKQTVTPPVEFIEGIPPEIDHPTFFKPGQPTLLLIDDLMSSCGNDSRITELFYEGSHHKSLSIVLLCQNLYFGKSPTERRNCHYVTLFKNPSDYQTIMTFARQVNPRKSKEFLQAYDIASRKPFGYLLADFRQTTDDKERLRANFLDVDSGKEEYQNQVPINSSLKEEPQSQESINSSVNEEPQNQASINRRMQSNTSHLKETHQLGHVDHEEKPFEDGEEENMPSCDLCGTCFDNLHDLQTHLTTWCPMNSHATGQPRWPGVRQLPGIGLKRVAPSYGIEHKRMKYEDMSEYECFAPIRKDLSKCWRHHIESREKEYRSEGYSKEIAHAKTVNENLKEIRKDLRETYANFINNWMSLTENSAIHQKVISKTEELHEDDNLSWIDAARVAIKEYKPLIDMNAMPEKDDDSELTDSDQQSHNEMTDSETE